MPAELSTAVMVRLIVIKRRLQQREQLGVIGALREQLRQRRGKKL
jgi:hypothetical protein